MAKAKVRIKGRFFLLLFLLGGLIIGCVAIANAVKKNGQIQFGSIGATLEVSAVVVRDETITMIEPYEKIVYNVAEGENVSTDQVIAQVYKRGYQDETMVSLLNLQKQIFNYQMQLLGTQELPGLAEINAQIADSEALIRAIARGESSEDMLSLELSLKALQSQRIDLLRAGLIADATLTNLYAELDAQQQTQENWKRDVVNTSGVGTISFYFDGYEQALCVNKLSTINSALVNTVVKGGNTASTTSSTSESPLYRVINGSHWFLVFVTKATEPMRLVAGEEYSVVFNEYSEDLYSAVARESVVSENAVVNVLEFQTDIGKMVGVRTVSATISKSAQGMIVPVKAIVLIDGVPGINIEYGDAMLRVEVDILAKDEKKAVIRARNASDTLVAGMKFQKP